MTDLSTTISPNSSQLNSDDLIAGPRTIRITKISANPSTPEQPISIFFEGDNGKPYKPCKSMRRVLVHTWGADGSRYPSRSMTLYRDPTVKFGGFEVGGIRISHMSDIAGPITIALTATRANRKPFTVQPLAQAGDTSAEDELLCLASAKRGLPELQNTWKSLGGARQRALAHKLDAFKEVASRPKVVDPFTGEIKEAEPQQPAADSEPADEIFNDGWFAHAQGLPCAVPDDVNRDEASRWTKGWHGAEAQEEAKRSTGIGRAGTK